MVAVLKDAGQTGSPVGRLTVAAASVADFGAVLLLSLLFSASGGMSAGGRLVMLAGFVLLTVVAVVGLRRGIGRRGSARS